MNYLTSIAKARDEILKDNEKPRDILISINLQHLILSELGPFSFSSYRVSELTDYLMGMKVEWTKPATLPQITIRTVKGDMKVVSNS